MSTVVLWLVFSGVVICVGCAAMSYVTYRMARLSEERCRGMTTNIFRERLRSVGLSEEHINLYAPQEDE